MHGATHHRKLDASSSFHFRHNVSPGKAVCTLGRTTLLIRRLTKNAVSSRVGSGCPTPVTSFAMRLGCRGIRSLVKGAVPIRAVGDVIADLRVGVMGRAPRNLALRIPPCHISIRHSYSMMRSVLHVCKCGGIRVPAALGSDLAAGNRISCSRGLRGLVSRRLMNYNFGRVLGGSLATTSCCRKSRACGGRGLICLVGPLDGSLGIVHRALLFNNLRDVRRGTGHGGTSLGFFRFNGYCFCGTRGGGPRGILTTCTRRCRLKL